MNWAIGKLIMQGLALCGVLGVASVTVFGADSAPKARQVPVTTTSSTVARTRSDSTPTTLAEAVPFDDGSGADSGFSGSGSSDASGDGFGGDGQGAVGGNAAPLLTTSTTAGTGPPPTVAESSVPLALPISAAGVIAVGLGVAAWVRRRAREPDPR